MEPTGSLLQYDELHEALQYRQSLTQARQAQSEVSP
jgi:hypothetical protein